MIIEDKMLNIMDNNQKIVVKASLTKKIIFKIGVQVMEHRCISAAVSRDE